MNLLRNQRGASAIGLLITLVIIGYAAYVGMQYIPQQIEFSAVESIFTNLEQNHRRTPYNSSQEVERAIHSQLNVNVMDDLRENFNIRRYGSDISVEVAYERELDLLYDKKKLQYAKKLTLK